MASVWINVESYEGLMLLAASTRVLEYERSLAGLGVYDRCSGLLCGFSVYDSPVCTVLAEVRVRFIPSATDSS